jgi:hypothetical protein
MSRASVFKKFFAKWADSQELHPQSAGSVRLLESKYSIVLPQAYREFIITYGNICTQDLLASIVDGHYDLSDVQYFETPEQAIESTEGYLSAGMPEGFVSFASDCMGNAYCFKVSECQMPDLDEAPIWFFDHDFLDVGKVSDSFEAWLARYNRVKRTRA